MPRSPKCFFPSVFLTNNKFLISPMCAVCPAHLIFLDLIILIISSEEYKLCNSLLCIFLQLPAISSLTGPDILLSTLFLNDIID